MHEKLARLLKQRSGNFIYVPNPGNAGDAFIAHATYQMFDRLGLRYEIGDISREYRGAIVVYGGGGNLVGHYHALFNFIQRNHDKWREFILLPHTVRDHVAALAMLGSNCFIFCREPASYSFVRAHTCRANVFLDQDMAFACDFDRSDAQARWLESIFYDGFLRRWHDSIRRRRWARKATIASHELSAIRTDMETTDLPVPSHNIDVSEAFRVRRLLPLDALHATRSMKMFLQQFDAVRTNRLHIGIMGAMLGLHVDLYDNSYGKVRDVYRHSMQGRFANVDWHERDNQSLEYPQGTVRIGSSHKNVIAHGHLAKVRGVGL